MAGMFSVGVGNATYNRRQKRYWVTRPLETGYDRSKDSAQSQRNPDPSTVVKWVVTHGKLLIEESVANVRPRKPNNRPPKKHNPLM